MKEKFINTKIDGIINITISEKRTWSCDKRELIENITNTIESFMDQGFKLTLRQLYYQLVAKDYIPNHDKVYKKIGDIVNDCRYSGLIDWEAIEDRGRIPHTQYYEHSIADAIKRTYNSYRLDRRKGQNTYIELWSEKDAISNILKQAIRDYTITVRINKGFASATSIYNAYHNFIDKILQKKPVVVLYFGDHDPSGLDMIRDITERLELMMSCGDHQRDLIDMYTTDEILKMLEEKVHNEDILKDLENIMQASDSMKKTFKWKNKFHSYMAKAVVREFFTVEHIGLTMEQIEFYNLPPNPAKLTDPRAKKYIAKHGQVSWEVDALQPDDLISIIDESLNDLVDRDTFSLVVAQELTDRKELLKLSNIYR